MNTIYTNEISKKAFETCVLRELHLPVLLLRAQEMWLLNNETAHANRDFYT